MREEGTVIVLVAVIAAALFGLTAFAMDVSSARSMRQRLQNAADAAVLAGAERIRLGDTATNIDNETRNIFTANSPQGTILSVQTGQWNNSTRVFTSGGAPSAVRIEAQQPSRNFFGPMLQLDWLFPRVQAVATVGVPTSVDCLIPYGIVQSALNGVHYGDELTVGVNNAGNWGKLDIGINSSSHPEFVDAVVNSRCTRQVTVGEQFDPGTGFAGISNALEQRMLLNPTILIPVVDSFPTGNSGQVTVLGFIVGYLVAQDNHGNRWNGTIRLLNMATGWNSSPGGIVDPYASTRMLVK